MRRRVPRATSPTAASSRRSPRPARGKAAQSARTRAVECRPGPGRAAVISGMPSQFSSGARLPSGEEVVLGGGELQVLGEDVLVEVVDQPQQVLAPAAATEAGQEEALEGEALRQRHVEGGQDPSDRAERFGHAPCPFPQLGVGGTGGDILVDQGLRQRGVLGTEFVLQRRADRRAARPAARGAHSRRRRGTARGRRRGRPARRRGSSAQGRRSARSERWKARSGSPPCTSRAQAGQLEHAQFAQGGEVVVGVLLGSLRCRRRASGRVRRAA